MGARAGATAKVRMRGSFIRMTSMLMLIVFEQRVTPVQPTPASCPDAHGHVGQHGSKTWRVNWRMEQPMMRCRFPKNQWYSVCKVEQRLATVAGKHETDGSDPVKNQ